MKSEKEKLMMMLKEESYKRFSLIQKQLWEKDKKILQFIIINFGILSLFTKLFIPVNNAYGIFLYIFIFLLFFTSLVILIYAYFPKPFRFINPIKCLNEYDLSKTIEYERALKEIATEDAKSFEQIAKVEKFHESRYRKLISNIERKEIFRKNSPVKWHCINCGYVSEGEEAPKICPACKHPQAFYEVLAENF